MIKNKLGSFIWAQQTNTNKLKAFPKALLSFLVLSQFDLKKCLKTAGWVSHQKLEFKLQAWAFATSLRDCSKPKRSENQTENWAQALAGAQCQCSK